MSELIALVVNEVLKLGGPVISLDKGLRGMKFPDGEVVDAPLDGDDLGIILDKMMEGSVMGVMGVDHSLVTLRLAEAAALKVKAKYPERFREVWLG